MYDFDKTHQIFEKYDDDHNLLCRWSMDLIERKDGQVWVMNHFFVNPHFNTAEALSEEMPIALDFAKKSGHSIWPLDPMVISFFEQHPAYHEIWYHRPFGK